MKFDPAVCSRPAEIFPSVKCAPGQPLPTHLEPGEVPGDGAALVLQCADQAQGPPLVHQAGPARAGGLHDRQPGRVENLTVTVSLRLQYYQTQIGQHHG